MDKPVDPDPRRALLEKLTAEAERGGGEDRIAKQHEAGKLTARERVELFLDPGSFVELDKFKTHRCADFGMEKQKILGPCAGGAVYSPAITDFIFMVKDTSYMFITGPDVIRTVTHEEVTKEDLGGARAHSQKSGVAHFTFDTEEATLRAVRELVSYLPLNNADDPPVLPCSDDPTRRDDVLKAIVPDNPNKPYDMKEVIKATVDDRHFFEVAQHYAENMVVGFARMNGRPIGVVANQPAVLAGVLGIKGSVKAARFVRFCDAFNIPILTF